MIKTYYIPLMFLIMVCGSKAGELKPKHNCNHTLRTLADTQMKFVDCIVINSSPANSCIKCSEEHSNMSKLWEVFAGNCSHEYINQNRLNIAYNVQKDLTGFWDKGFCDDCFDTNKHLSNETNVFINFTHKFEDCLLTNPVSEVCQLCQQHYIVLNDFYKKMDEEKNGRICFDTQDKMNRTRSRWSKDLKCCHRQYSLMFFTIASTLFGVLPIIFYFGMYSYTKRMERNHEVLDAGSSTGLVSPSNEIQSIVQNETRTVRADRSIDSDEDIIDNLKSNGNARASGGKTLHPEVETVQDELSPATTSVENAALIDL